MSTSINGNGDITPLALTGGLGMFGVPVATAQVTGLTTVGAASLSTTQLSALTTTQLTALCTNNDLIIAALQRIGIAV